MRGSPLRVMAIFGTRSEAEAVGRHVWWAQRSSGSFGLLLPFLLYGLVVALRRSGFVRGNALLLLFAGFYTILHVPTWAMVRYRLPVDAALMPVAALGAVDLFQRARAVIARRVS